MICERAISPRGAALVKRHAGGVLVLAALAAMTASGCAKHAPKGQVVAVVNGQDITSQDVETEGLSLAPRRADKPTLTQRVVARVLLAQSAHAQKLDSEAGYPSQLQRLQQTFLAQRLLQRIVKPPAKPTAAELATFMAAHPYAFGRRMKVKMDELRFSAGDDLKQLAGADTLPAIETRLKSLNTPTDRRQVVIDTAQLPPALADKIATSAEGQVFFIHEGDSAIAITTLAREPVAVPPEQQTAAATQMMNELSTQRTVDAEITRLRNQAKIAYQPDYAPPKTTARGAAASAAPKS